MAWIIFTVILGILFWGGVAYAALSGEKAVGYGVAALAAVVETVLTIALSVATISTGQVGLVYNFAGKLTGTIDKQGIVWKQPWSSIKKENVQIQRETFQLDTSNAAVSADQQPIYATLVLNYQVDPKHVFDLYKNVGSTWKAKLVDSRVLQDFKEITATYPTTKITNAREQLREDTRKRLQAELGQYSIDVKDFFIQNIGFAPSYTAAVESKQVQVQQAQQAEAKVAQVQAEAQQAVAQAQGQAEAKVALARAEAQSNRLISSSITDKLIEMTRAKALQNANTIYVPSGTNLFLNPGK